MASFPGYDTATSLFIAWANTLRAQASSWNDFWVKLKDGNVQFSDWIQTMVGSIEAFTSLSEQAWYSLWGPAAPPWANLPFPPNAAPIPVKILKAVNKDNPIDRVPLALLGENQKAELSLQVTITAPNELTLFVDDGDWKDFLKKGGQSGQYVGLIFSRDHIDPVAIVSFRATSDELARERTATSDVKGLAFLGGNAPKP